MHGDHCTETQAHSTHNTCVHAVFPRKTPVLQNDAANCGLKKSTASITTMGHTPIIHCWWNWDGGTNGRHRTIHGVVSRHSGKMLLVEQTVMRHLLLLPHQFARASDVVFPSHDYPTDQARSTISHNRCSTETSWFLAPIAKNPVLLR